MKNLPLLLGTLVVSIVLIVGIAVLFSNSSPSNQLTADISQLVDGASIVVGSDSAPVTLVEFSDFQCPACKASQPFVKEALNQYPDQIRFVFRHYPLEQIHPFARTAAQSAQAAHMEGKFLEYADLLFDRQAEWSALDSNDLVKQTLSQYAAELGIDSAGFLEKMDSADVVAAVQNDLTLGASLKITATPTFFVNDNQTAAPELLDAVKSALEQSAD